MKRLLKAKNMKQYKFHTLALILILFINGVSVAQSEKKSIILGLGYYNDNNLVQYLKAGTKAKINGKFSPVAGIPVKFYIQSESAEHFLGSSTTGGDGQAFLMITPNAQEEWNKSEKQSFLAVTDSSLLYDAATTSIELTKAKILLDTADGKKINARLVENQGSKWIPVKGVDMKIAVKRLGGNLSATETPVFTTDSLGAVNADFSLTNLPGDSSGNIILIASVEDNDLYGNMTTERTVPWGAATSYVSDFNNRSLFARSGRPPYWLLFMSGSITLSVWLVLFYLFYQIYRLKKLGA
jgi:hypothetical protein